MGDPTTELGLAVVGCGHWGPNLVRVFSSLPGVTVRAACDPDPGARARILGAWPGLRVEEDLSSVLEDPRVEAVALATPAASHAALAHRCLEARRHVLVEKPVGISPDEVVRLAEAARRADRLLMGGHVFLHHPAVRAVGDLLAGGVLGRLRHVRCLRANPGPVRTDVSVVWDLMPHDVAMLWLWLGGAEPVSVNALAAHPLGTARADTVFASLAYPDGTVAQLTASWIEPAKVRRAVLVGADGACEFDDLDLRRPLRLVRSPLRGDRSERYYDGFGEFHSALEEGPMELLAVGGGEPLREECMEFARRVRSGVRGAGPEEESIARCLARIEQAARTGRPA